MTLPESCPSRVWICPGCQKPFNQRWLLARHLRTVHRLKKKAADDVAKDSEYVLSPRYLKKDRSLDINPNDYYQE